MRPACERIVAAFGLALAAGPRQHLVKVSIGTAAYPADGRSTDDALSSTLHAGPPPNQSGDQAVEC